MTPRPFTEIWVYLAATPLLGLTLTLVAYQSAYALYRRAAYHPLLNPVLVAVAMIVAVLATTGTGFQTYFDGAQFVHFLLGPAVVALAVPLARQWDSVRPLAWPIAGALLAGALVALATVVGIAWALGATLGKYVLDALKVTDWRVRGFALGVAAHGIARAFQVNAEAGAFAGLAFGLHRAFAALAFPLLYWLLRAATPVP